jgi:hypothetical protein
MTCSASARSTPRKREKLAGANSICVNGAVIAEAVESAARGHGDARVLRASERDEQLSRSRKADQAFARADETYSPWDRAHLVCAS